MNQDVTTVPPGTGTSPRRRYKKEYERLGYEREHLNIKRDTQRSIARVKKKSIEVREVKNLPKSVHLGLEHAITLPFVPNQACWNRISIVGLVCLFAIVVCCLFVYLCACVGCTGVQYTNIRVRGEYFLWE